jgi:hypothetical protein
MPLSYSEYTPPIYHDKWIRLIGIPVITAFGYYLTYNNIQFNGWFIYELLSDAFKIYLIWQLVRWCVIALDKRFPWATNFGKRLFIQVPVTCGLGILGLSILVNLEYAFIRPYRLEHFWNFDLVIAFIFLLLVNAVYISLYFYQSYEQSQAEKKALAEQLEIRPGPVQEYVVVRHGKREVVVPYAEILCFYSEAKETYLVTSQHKSYLLETSLDRLEEQLPEPLFLRANRKFIITPDLVDSFAPEAYGKLAVHLKPLPKLPAIIIISRDKAPVFRRWLKR